MGKGQIDFPAYCRTFEILKDGGLFDTGSICGFLDDGREFYVVDTMSGGVAGDGIVSVPEYRLVLGQSRVVGSRLLTQDGKVILKSDGKESVLASVDPEAARYFIAGAFGAGELKGGEAPDRATVDGLRKLYPLCVEDSRTCLDSPEAKAVAATWRGIKAARAAREAEQSRLAERREGVAKLRKEYEQLAATIEKKSALSAGVAPYVGALSADPATETELAASEQALTKMIAVAKGIAEEEKAQREREQRRVELASYRSAMPGMREKISKAEGSWYSRFTDAYDAAMACMPIPSSPEEEHCVARNAYMMGTELASKASNFPERSVCTEWTAFYKTSCTHSGEGAGCDEVRSDQECKRSHTEGVDYTADELRSFATGYCTTQCH